MPSPRTTLPLLVATVALAAGAFGLGRALRHGGPDDVASSASFTTLGKASTAAAVPRLGHAAALPKLLLRHASGTRTSAGTSVSPRPDDAGATAAGPSGAASSGNSAGTTSASTASPKTTTKQPSSSTKKTDPTDNSVSSGGNSLGG